MKDYKGIILAGGYGTRLYPSTQVLSKQLLPVYDKPMIYYPLSVLMLAEIKDILIISTSCDINKFEQLLGDGSNFGIKLSYKIQQRPEGLAHAFILAEDFLMGSPSCLILGDNIFYGNGLTGMLLSAKSSEGSTVFAYQVSDPERYGVVEFNENKMAISLEEKPKNPKSNFAITGLYFYDKYVVEYAKSLNPSLRGELEITDLNKMYLNQSKLNVVTMKRGYAWLDTGTHDSLLEASNFIQTMEHRQGVKIACLEEIAYYKGWINKEKINNMLKNTGENGYTSYLRKVVGD